MHSGKMQAFKRLMISKNTQSQRFATSVKLPSVGPKLTEHNDVFIFDCDGVIWWVTSKCWKSILSDVIFFRKGDTLIAGAKEALNKLRKLNKQVFFITNNSTKSRNGYLKKFQQLGVVVYPDGTSYSLVDLLIFMVNDSN